jgi:peptidoglycan/LPS O-acetylase OafA/YrhL
LPSLDGVRALAILLVVALHFGFIVHPATTGLPKSYVPGGFAGVDVFFVLSGFLITSLLLEERQRRGAVSLNLFYIRRGLRLLPALALLLAVHLVYALQQGLSIKREAEALASIAFYASNVTQSVHKFMPAELSHTWSLAVEEQFYLVWPGLLLVLLSARAFTKSGRERLPLGWTFVGALLLTNVARIIVWRTQGYPAAYMLPYCHADGLIVGCGLAFLRRDGRLPVKGAAVAGWLGLGALLAFALFYPQTSSRNAIYYGGYTLIALASAAIINAVLVGEERLNRAFSWTPLVATGRVSYGLYLWHVMIFELLLQHNLGLGRWPRAILGLVLSLAATLVSWFVVEQPALRLKTRYSTRPRVSPTVAPEPT